MRGRWQTVARLSRSRRRRRREEADLDLDSDTEVEWVDEEDAAYT
jgi:hypothetical protein